MSITTPPPSSTPTARSSASTAKCTFRTTHSTTKKFYFSPGDTGFPRLANALTPRIGVLICWDQWFPEGARLTALQGAQILFYPTAIGWHPSEKTEYGPAQHESWELIQRSHAIANGCYVCAPNRIGLEKIAGPNGKPVNDDGIEFWGQSFIAAPNGQIVAKAHTQKEAVLITDCDLEKVEFSRTHWPFLRDRRIDAYADMTKRFIEVPREMTSEDIRSDLLERTPLSRFLASTWSVDTASK